MKTSLRQVEPLARRFSEWVATLDSRPREKQLAIGTGIVAALFAWFALALGAPLLLVALPLLGGMLFGAVHAQRRLEPVEGPVEFTLDRVAPRGLPALAADTQVQTSVPEHTHEEDEGDEDGGWEDEGFEDEGDSLLSRLSLAPPPPPVGRSSASYVYEPEPDFEPEPFDDEDSDREPDEQSDRHYEVCEAVAGRSIVRYTSPSLFGATDFALELHIRSRGTDIEVVRVRGEARESVLRFTRDAPPEGSASAKSLLELFGYPVTRWKGPAG